MALERRIRAYIRKHGRITTRDIDEPSKVVRQVLKRMPDLKVIGTTQVDYYMCSRGNIKVWGFK